MKINLTKFEEQKINILGATISAKNYVIFKGNFKALVRSNFVNSNDIENKVLFYLERYLDNSTKSIIDYTEFILQQQRQRELDNS